LARRPQPRRRSFASAGAVHSLPLRRAARSLPRRTDEAAEELTSLLEEEGLAGIPVLIFANKQDLLGAMSAAEVMSELELTSQKDRFVHVQACSAKTGEGLEDGIKELLKNVNKS